jgi:hypothetical protein
VRAVPSRPVRPAPWRGLATAALAALAVLAGVADLHLHRGGTAGELVGHLGAVPEQGEPLFLGASHPGSAPHAEAAGGEVHFRCPVCAQHLQSAHEAPDGAAGGRVPPSATLAGPPAPLLASAALLQPGGPRAPPLR